MADVEIDLSMLARFILDEGNFNLPTLRRKAIELYDNYYPGFFAPFKSGRDFGLSLAAPIGIPLVLGTITALLGVASVISATICVTSLITMGVCAVLQRNNARNEALSLFVLSGFATMALPLFVVLTSVVTVAALIVPLVSLVSRTGATIVHGISNVISTCCTKNDEVLEEGISTELDTVTLAPSV